MSTRHFRPVRHDVCMDRHALERLGHHVVSRRVALGYRNRTDLANSLQFTVRTLADIEHGVRKASPGTYAMLENKLSWAPGSIDTILAGGEPQEIVVELRRTTPSAAISRRHRCPIPCLHRGATAGAPTPHHRATQQTARNWDDWGGLEPSRRLGRGGDMSARIISVVGRAIDVIVAGRLVSHLRLAAGVCVLAAGLLMGSAGGAVAVADTRFQRFRCARRWRHQRVRPGQHYGEAARSATLLTLGGRRFRA